MHTQPGSQHSAQMGIVSQSFLQYYLHGELATPMVLTKGMPNGREICIFLIFPGRYIRFDVKNIAAFSR